MALTVGRTARELARLPRPAAEALRRGDEVVLAGRTWVVMRVEPGSRIETARGTALERAPGGGWRVPLESR